MKTLVAISLILLSVSFTNAQISDSTTSIASDYKSTVVLERMTRELSLTKKQANSVKKVLDERFTAIASKLSDRKAQIINVNKVTLTKLESILTKEQLLKLKELQNEKKLIKVRYYADNPEKAERDEDAELDF